MAIVVIFGLASGNNMRHWQNKLQRKSFYGSHMPVISRVMEETTGPVLELGMGIYSTPLLDLMCHESKRELVSYDDDKEWFEENKGWESDYHKVIFIDNYDNADIESRKWSVVLVDHKPAIRRITEIRRLSQNADYVIIHDSEPECDKFFKYSRIYPLFKYRYDYKITRPNTTILSNFKDPKILYK